LPYKMRRQKFVQDTNQVEGRVVVIPKNLIELAPFH